MNTKSLYNPDVDETWELWVQDQFDWETPRKVELRGKGLILGLSSLWQYHLRESITPNGQQGFSKFNLWLPGLKKSYEIQANHSSLARIHNWVFGLGECIPNPEGINYDLLELLGRVHCYLISSGQTEEEIVRIAEESKHSSEFSRKLKHYW